MTSKLALLAAVSAFSLLGVPLGAKADQINLLGTNGVGINLTGNGTLVNVNIPVAFGDGAVFQSGATNTLGNYTLGPVNFNAGPNVNELYAAGANSESFAYTDAVDSLTGTIHWTAIQDNTTNPKFFGSLVVATSTGSAAFTAAFPVGGNNAIDMTTSALGGLCGATPHPCTLDDIVAGSLSRTVGVSSGEIVPGPIVGAGLPGLVAACGGLLALARRRRRKQTA
jgi:hypothetical protein